MIVGDQSEVIAALSRPDMYGPSVATVEQIRTHASIVFLAGDRAWKLKRAVRFPYLDYSTLDLRHRFCQAEVRINRRTAPEIYHGAIPVTRDASGALTLGGDGTVVEWLVEMTRFDQQALFDHLAATGKLDRFLIEDLADVVAAFHAAADRRSGGGRRGIQSVIDGNAKSFRECPPGVLDEQRAATVVAVQRRLLEQIGPLLDRRRDEGQVRHCHGDLHLRNIVLHDGRPTMFDAIEFDESIAAIDILYDLAFLVMDLHHRGLAELACILLNRYLDATGDAAGLAALPLFLSVRAAIRAHVDAVASARQAEPDTARDLIQGARRYLDRAEDDLRPVAPRLIAIGGLSGTGKSRLARMLAPGFGRCPGARVVRSDSTRKRLAGVALTTRLDADGYTHEVTERTFRAMFDEAGESLDAGFTVIADAVFASPAQRDDIAAVARAGDPVHRSLA